jgi:hypothetical protein
MILDSEQQKQELLGALSMVMINGPFGQVAGAVQSVGQLIETIKKATIALSDTPFPPRSKDKE